MSHPVIVLDNGTGYLKAGLSNSDIPTVTIPSLVGRPMLRYAEKIEDVELKPIMIGDEIIPVRSLLELTYPMEEGIVKHEEEMELLWDYCIFNKLGIKKDEVKEHKLLLTEAPFNPIANKVKMAEILFEKIGIGAFNIEPQAKLTIFCEGAETGLVLDSGDGVTHVIPIGYSCLLHNQIQRLNIAGRHVTNYLIKLLQLKGYAFNSTADFEAVRELKEKYCFVSCDIESDRKLDKETTYYNTDARLPDGRRIRLSNEKFEAPEIMFEPYLIENEQPGISDMVYNCINQCDIDIRKELYKMIVLSGATTMLPGYASRLAKDIRKLFVEKNLKQAASKDVKMKIEIIDSPRRKYSVYIGGAVLANTYNSSEFDKYWITAEEYKESGGENIIRKKCSNIIQ